MRPRSRHLEAAYDAAPGQRATRQLLGESYALAGDAAGAAALWRTVDLGQGQLSAASGGTTPSARPPISSASRRPSNA